MRFVTKMGLILATLLALAAFGAVAEDAPVEKTDGFVCPVLGGQAGEDHGNSSPDPIKPIAEGDYTVVGPDVTVPVHATNDDGEGRPDGPHDSPGDDSYTAIWANQ